jgi:hypothetical protein
MGGVQPAVCVGAGTLELQEFSLPNTKDCEQTLYARAMRLVRLGLRIFHVN